jgi:hypothetical protein
MPQIGEVLNVFISSFHKECASMGLDPFMLSDKVVTNLKDKKKIEKLQNKADKVK